MWWQNLRPGLFLRPCKTLRAKPNLRPVQDNAVRSGQNLEEATNQPTYPVQLAELTMQCQRIIIHNCYIICTIAKLDRNGQRFVR